MDLNNLLLLACKVSLDGGQEIMKVYKTNFVVDHKNDNSPLTLADTKSHDVIFSGLAQSELPVLSGEGVELDYEIRKH